MCKHLIILLTLIAFTASCARVPTCIEPVVQAPPHPKEVQREKRFLLCLPPDFSVSPFAPLSPAEQGTDWGKEYKIALCFAEDFDLYRAITGFKRALCLIPSDANGRRMELEYMITLAYYLGQKYVEVVYAVESTDLLCIDATFPAWRDLLLILYESYEKVGRPEHAAHMVKLLEQQDPEAVCKLTLLSIVKQADFDALCQEAQLNQEHAYLDRMMGGYRAAAKSIRRAQTLNAMLPGAGYWYVGLKQTAVTAFLINGLFIAAGVHLLNEGHGAAGAIVLSLEGGWYFGGIAGAGYAAKAYNEHLYCSYANKITQREAYFPSMMLNYTF